MRGQRDPRQTTAELLQRVDEWTVENAIASLAQQIEDGRDTHLFVKLSEQALGDEQMLLSVGKKLRAAQLPGNHLILQVSEAAAVSQVRSVKAFIKGLRELHCLAALEDFGTGLNSLNTLKSLDVPPLDVAEFETAVKSSVSEAQYTYYKERGSLDIGVDFEMGDQTTHRFRINIFRTRGRSAIAAPRYCAEPRRT